MLLFSLTQPHQVSAQDVAPILRAHALEIVDDRDRLRAEIKVLPPQTGYPETVILRLKLEATEDGSGMVLGGQTGTKGYTQLNSRTDPYIKIVNKDGRQQILKP